MKLIKAIILITLITIGIISAVTIQNIDKNTKNTCRIQIKEIKTNITTTKIINNTNPSYNECVLWKEQLKIQETYK